LQSVHRTRDLSIVVLTCAWMIAVSEIVVRFVDRTQCPEIPPGGNHPRGLFIPDSSSGYSLRPGFEGKMVNAFGDWNVPVRIDQRGNRYQDEPMSSESLLFLGLGDSFTYGEGVKVDSTYLAHVERELESRCGRSIRMVSAGVPGYSARQMLSRFRSILHTMTPSFVILGLTAGGGDRLDDPFVELGGYIARSSYAPRLEVVGDRLVESVSAPSGIRFLDSRAKVHSHLYRRIVFLGNKAQGRCPSKLVGDPYAEARAARSEAWADSMRAIVREFAGVCNDIHARALVVLVDATPAQEGAVAPVLTAAGLPFIPLAIPLETHQRKTGESLVFEHDDHWNSKGHRLVANLVVERILQEQWIQTIDPAGIVIATSLAD